MQRSRLELAAASTDIDAARDVARALNGTLYSDERDDWQALPFRALVTAVTDDLDALTGIADVGSYVVCRRLIKPGRGGVFGLFPLIRRPDLSHRAADTHWRDVHAPLALEHHAAMSQYTQLSVLQQISGTSYDGFALCGFESIDDLRQRFFTTPASRDVILADIARFADTRKSPRRLIALETSFRVGAYS
jgi:uncharacterized protein (TIGR02118 family)